MKCISRILKAFVFTAAILSTLFGVTDSEKGKVYINDPKEIVHIDFSNLKIEDLVNLSSKILNKNILITTPVTGEVNFISTTPIYKDEIFDILLYVLDSKGFTMVDDGPMLRIVRSADASKENLPIIHIDKTKMLSKNQIVTEAFYVKGENVDIVASKIRHLLTNQAKLITIKESNTILLTDAKSNIETVKKIIDAIKDDTQRTIETIELKNLKAASILANAQKLATAMFNQRVDTEKLEFISDVQTNTIVLVGIAENVQYIKEYIERLDNRANTIEQKFEVIPLKNSDVKNMIKVVTEIIGKKIYQDPEARPLVSANEEINAIVVLGPKDEIDIVKAFVEELDKDQQQVYVKAKIVEISQTKSEKLGFKYGLEGGLAKKYGLFTLATNMGGSAVSLSSSISSFIDTSVISEGLAIGAALDLLSTNEAANIVSEPSILCINNKQSSIYVGQTQSILTSAVSGENANDLTRNTYKREDIGLTLNVKPRISSDNKVTLEVEVKLEDVIAGSGGGGQPTTTKREVKTVAIVKNGETVIVGGLIKDKQSENTNKIPLLGDIPLVGSLFKNNVDANDKTNLVLLITPYVVPKSSDLTHVREILKELDSIQSEYNKKSKEAREEEVSKEGDSYSDDAVNRILGK